MKKGLLLLLAVFLPLSLLVAGCSSSSDGADSASGDGAASLAPFEREKPSDASVPNVEPPLESHTGDGEHFYVTSDDYVVWAKPSTHTAAEQEYRVASFDATGLLSSAFLKYVFADEAGAETFATTNDQLIQMGNVVYYKAWMGPESQDKAGLLELVNADGSEHYISKP